MLRSELNQSSDMGNDRAEQTPSANNVDRAKNTYRLPKFAQLTREEPKVAYCINRSSGADELIGTPLESAEFPPPVPNPNQMPSLCILSAFARAYLAKAEN